MIITPKTRDFRILFQWHSKTMRNAIPTPIMKFSTAVVPWHQFGLETAVADVIAAFKASSVAYPHSNKRLTRHDANSKVSVAYSQRSQKLTRRHKTARLSYVLATGNREVRGLAKYNSKLRTHHRNIFT